MWILTFLLIPFPSYLLFIFQKNKVHELQFTIKQKWSILGRFLCQKLHKEATFWKNKAWLPFQKFQVWTEDISIKEVKSWLLNQLSHCFRIYL